MTERAPRSRFRTVGLALVAIPTAVALIRTATATSAPLPARAEATVAVRVATRIAQAEDSQRANARRNFPGDAWSADDDFHNQERRLAHALAGQYKLGIADVFHIIDADIRAHRVEGRKSNAAPCKPRPFYD